MTSYPLPPLRDSSVDSTSSANFFLQLPNQTFIQPATAFNPSPSADAPLPSSRKQNTNKRLASSSLSVSNLSSLDTQELDASDEEEEDDIAVNMDCREAAGTIASGSGSASSALVKAKKTRGSRACLSCRKLKMRCVPVEFESAPSPCKRCTSSGFQCVFEESARGRQASRKRDELAKSLKKMEVTLSTVLHSIGKYGMLTDSATEPTLPLIPQAAIQLPVQGAEPTVAPLSLSPPTSPDVKERESQVLIPLDTTDTNDRQLGVIGTTYQSPKDSTLRLHSLPADSLNPLGLMVEASLQNDQGVVTLREVLDASDGDLNVLGSEESSKRSRKRGVANERYFLPGPLQVLSLRRIILNHRLPSILLAQNIITPDEVVELFDLYFSKCHLAVPLLDGVLHTPEATGERSPFLFTTICTVASRYYTKRTDDLYSRCLKVARQTAFEVVARGFKSPEIVQAFLLLTHWNAPSERYEEERSYQFSGIAIRMAQDLNLHRKAAFALPTHLTDSDTIVQYEREILNRERAWLLCFICDRTISAQMGKPHSISREDSIIRNSKRWFLQAQSQSSDAGFSMVVEMHRIVTRILDTLYSDTRSATGLNENLDYPIMIQAFVNQLDQWKEDWSIICPTKDENDYDSLIRSSMRCFYYEYYRLFVLSFALQFAMNSPDSLIDLPKYSAAAFRAASSIISIARDVLSPQGFFRYCPDHSFVFISYACCFLLKLMSPNLAVFINPTAALALVNEGAYLLEVTAVDSTHIPVLYANFIRALLANRENGGHHQTDVTAPRAPVTELSELDSHFGEYRQFTFGEFEEQAEKDESVVGGDEIIRDGFWNDIQMPGFEGLFGPQQTDMWSFTPWASRVGSRAGSPGPGSSAQMFGFTP